MSVTILKRITTEAKKIRKRHPNMKWVDAVKQAGRKIKKPVRKSAKKSAIKKPVRAIAKRSAPRRVNPIRNNSHKTAAHYVAQARAILLHDLGSAEARKFVATTKSAKRKIQKYINDKKSKIRKLTT